MNREVELKVHDLSSTIHPVDAYALVLEEVEGPRKLPIIIGHLEAQAIKVMLAGYDVPRPLTHDILIEIGKRLDLFLHKVVIYKVKDGVFYSHLHYSVPGEEFVIDSRTSDAVAIALRCGAPIYTTDELLSREQMREIRKGSFAVPANSISLAMLKEAMQKAVDEEDYEQASRLRDEIKRREQEVK